MYPSIYYTSNRNKCFNLTSTGQTHHKTGQFQVQAMTKNNISEWFMMIYFLTKK